MHLGIGMPKILTTAALIAVPYSLIVAFLSVFVTMRWVRVFEADTQTTLYGADAVLYLIQSEGLLGYLLGLAPQFAFFLATVFIALVIQGLVLKARKNA